MREGFTLFFVELSLSFFFFCPLLLPMMPPKRGKGAHTAKRGDETPRQPDDGRVTVAVAPTGITTSCALDRRPHHLVSRLHPPWSAPGCINSGGNHLQSLHTSGAASSKAAAPPTRSRAVPPTRVAERSVVAQKDDHKDTAATTTVRPSAAARRSGATKTAGQKRFRSPSASNPIEVESENSAEAEEKEESRERTSGHGDDSDDEDDDISPSPLPMVAESKKLRSSAFSSSDNAGPAESGAGSYTGKRATAALKTNTTRNTRAGSTDSTASEPVSTTSKPAQKGPLNTTATSTANCKTLFGDDSDGGEEEERRMNDPVVWSASQGSAPAQDAVATPNSVSTSSHRFQDTHVLGVLSDRASLTPTLLTRTTAVTHVQSSKPQVHNAKRFAAEEDHHDNDDIDGDENELLGELSKSAETATHTASRHTKPQGGVVQHPPPPQQQQDVIGEETENQAVSTGPTTPSLLPAHDSVSSAQIGRSLDTDSETAMATAAVAGEASTTHFAETLAVQDLSFLPEENGNTTTQGEASQLLPSLTQQQTPRLEAAADPAARGGLTPVHDEDEGKAKQRGTREVLLGEASLSPPVKRATATPQQAGQADKDGATTAPSAYCELHPPPPLLTRLSASTTTTTSVAPLLTPHMSSRTAATDEAVEPKTTVEAIREASLSPSAASSVSTSDSAIPPPQNNSLPSTLDDGCWKDDDNTPLRTPPSSLVGAAGQRTGADFNTSLALATSALLQETVPIDRFLCTPSQGRKSRPAAPHHTELLSKEDEGEEQEGNSKAALQRINSTTTGKKVMSRNPPRRGPKQPAVTDVDQQGITSAATNACNAADVDPAVLKVGSQVEGCWGRKWFPAVVREAPRNGFVQIEWVEDGSLLHVRLREVRLPAAAPPVPAVAVSTKGAVESEEGREGEGAVLTATQLVALMEEEDAEDSRHEVERHDTARVSGNAGAANISKPVASVSLVVDSSENGEAAVDVDEKVSLQRRGRKRGKSSTPLPAPPLPPSPPPPPPLAAPAGSASDDLAKAVAPTAGHEPTALPLESTPSALCVYLAASVRRELLMGTCNPSSGAVAASTEVQRNTELQRILNYLTSAGAAVISSLAQADSIASQLGDKENTGTRFQRTQATGPGRFTALAEHSSSLPNAGSLATSSDGMGGVPRRKTVGRVPLPRKSGATTNAPVTAAASPKRYFIFLVASAASSATSSTAEPVRDGVVRHLPDVCVAHAFGVSAIHASWLWSVVPGALHVRLPTTLDEVVLPTAWMGSAVKEPSAVALTPAPPANVKSSSALPLRLTPFPTCRRWLCGTAVQFMERDDAVETWLNAAGAVVTAEPPPPSPLPPPSSPPPAIAGVATRSEESGDIATEIPLAAVAAAARRHSVSLSHHQSQPPPRKQPCVEKRPDYVYVREVSVSAPVDLKRLGGVPVVRLPWLIQGIERNYKTRCADGSAASSSGKVGQHSEGNGAAAASDKEREECEALPLLSSVWEEMQRATAEAAAHLPSQRERPITPAEPHRAEDQPTGTADAHAHPLANSKEAVSGCEHNAVAATESDGEVAGTCTAATSAVDGNTRPFYVRNLDARRSAVPDNNEPAAAPALTTGVSSPRLVGDSAADGNENNDEEHRQSGDGHHAGRADDAENEEVVTQHENDEPADERAGGEAPTGPLNSNATPHRPQTTHTCTHPPIAVGEDYYVSLAIPSTASTQMAIPAATIAVGRVIALQHHVSSSVLGDNDNYVDESGDRESHSSLLCLAVLQLYETKYVSMHVDPRSGTIVHQTTVFLTQQRITVPTASLLFDVPVYVITTAARQHVYFLDEPDDMVPPGHHNFAALSDAPLNEAQESSAYPVSPPQQRYLQSTAVSASPAPTSPLPRQQASILLRGGHADDSVMEGNPAMQRWTVNAVQQRRLSPSKDPTKPQQAPSHAVANDHTTAHGETNVLLRADSGTAKKDLEEALSSTPRTLDVAELEDRSPHSAVVARHAVQAARGTSSQYRISLGTAPRAARLLAQLSLDIGGKTVVLRPGSHISFYARRALSMSELRLSQAQRYNSSSQDQLSLEEQAEREVQHTNATQPSHGHTNNDDDDSDSSEEIIAEAPLVGEVDMLREMDGVVDIIVHTAQPNGIFGGSKMYRVTPDMIVDVAP